MARQRKRHQKLPNGYGSIRWLGGNRRNPYAVCPPVTEYTEDGKPIQPKPICYVGDWYVGFAVLTAWHGGTYKPGDEVAAVRETGDPNALCQSILSAYTASKPKKRGMTFAEVYERYHEWKFGENAPRKLSKATEVSTAAAYKHCEKLHGMEFASIRHADLQACVDGCQRRSASKEGMVTLLHQMWKYAIMFDIVEKDASAGLVVPPCDDEHGVPFSDGELEMLWGHSDSDVVRFLLVMCYSGYRISAYETMEVNLEEGYFRGGVKTASSKDRVVPIHSAIAGIVKDFMRKYGKPIPMGKGRFRKAMAEELASIGIAPHTPHDCRHTFSRLCEAYGVREADRKRMMGHSFGSDITNGVYGHRTLEELRAEIEKIEVPWAGEG